MIRTLSKNEAKVVLDLEWRGQRTVTSEQLRSILGASDGYARFLAHRLVQKGWLERIRPGVFQSVPADRGPEGVGDTNPLAVGAVLAPSGFFSYGTACTHHGLTEQVFSEVYMAIREPRRPTTVRATRYVFVALAEPRLFGFEQTTVLGAVVNMATRERALVDALDRPDYAGGICEVARITSKAATRIDWALLISYLKKWNESAVVQRLGYLLDRSRIHWPSRVRDSLVALVHPRSRLHLGPRRDWGTHGPVCMPWGIIENVPPDRLFERQRERHRTKAFPKRGKA